MTTDNAGVDQVGTGHANPLAAAAVRVATDQAAVMQLVVRERHSRDRGWWDDWAACFADDSVVDMSWFIGSGAEFVARTRQRSSDGVWGQHRLCPPAVRVVGDRAWAELPLAIEFGIQVGDVDALLVSHCRSQYRARRTNGVWQIVRITSIYERDTITATVPGTSLELTSADIAELAKQRPSSRCLGWYLSRIGTPLRTEVLGDDQPEAVARHYQAESTWLDDDASSSTTGTTIGNTTTAAADPAAAHTTNHTATEGN